jgi:hypothetical protein
VVVVAASLAACASSSSSPVTTVADVPATVAGVGSLPPLGLMPMGLGGSANTFPNGESVPRQPSAVGEAAEGPRILMIGDSIMAALSRRYSNLACKNLTPLGWQISIEAEIGRAVEFGPRVLAAKMDETWHAAVVFLGTNYWRDQDKYEADLVRILDRLEPRPTVLISVSEWRNEQREVNEVIADQVLNRDNVWFIDWRTISRTPGVLSSDDIHPSNEGNQLLVTLLAETLGRAPGGAQGACLPSEFSDDQLLPDGYVVPGTEDGESSDSVPTESSAPASTLPGATTTLP